MAPPVSCIQIHFLYMTRGPSSSWCYSKICSMEGKIAKPLILTFKFLHQLGTTYLSALFLLLIKKKRGGSLHKSVWAPIDLRRHCSNLCLHTLCSHHPATISPYPLECDTTLPSLLWPLSLLLGFTPFTPAYTNFVLGDSPCLNPCFLPVITIEAAPQLQDWPCGSEPAKVILSFLPKRSRMGTARAKPGSTRSPPAPARAQGWSNQSKA